MRSRLGCGRGGLALGEVSKNGLIVPLSATTGQIARAFSVSFERVRLPSGGVAFANMKAPRFAAPVVPLIQGVIGLDTVYLPQPLSVRKLAGIAVGPRADGSGARALPPVMTGWPRPCTAAASAAPGDFVYTADELASAYGFSGLYGAGMKAPG